MYKIISVFLFLCFLIADARYDLSDKSKPSQDVPINSAEKKISYRLPETVKPNSYYIDLKVHLDESQDKNFTFSGTVNISLNVEQPTKNITLHSKDLNINDLSIAMVFNNFLQPIGVKYDANETNEFYDDQDFLTITEKNSEVFVRGQYVLSVMYEGKLNDNLLGFFRSYYVNDKGEKGWFATSNFEPIFARCAFPCFDEPALKATFHLKITHSSKLKAISNTKSIVTTDNKDGTTTTEFRKTPLMSTYLLAFAISDFKSIHKGNNFTVHVRPNAIQYDDLATEKGVEILKKLEDFTNISFEMGKMDQFAIPQFSIGAMENWGLIIYREERLFSTEKVSAMTIQNIVITIAHEFAHQWFGNLVSPKWWKYVWLNEGFATFFSYYITDQVDKTFRSVEQSVVQIMQILFVDDSKNTTYAINKAVESPKEIMGKFSVILYIKGMAVIRMMQHYVTNEVFKKGIQRYLNDFNHKAADSDNLFNSIQKVVDEENLNIQVKTVMDTWINQKGYPIVTARRDYEKNTIIIKQERFTTYNASAEEKNNFWYIPINYATEKNPDFENTSAHLLLNTTEKTFPIDGAEKQHWIILNKQVTGIYRVNYDEDNWKLIINYLNSSHREKIHPLNRAQLINDALVFVKERLLGLHILIRFIPQLKYETDYVVWNSAIDVLIYLSSKLRYSEYYPSFKEYAHNAMTSLIKTVGLKATDNDDHIKKLTRETIISTACSLGHSDCKTLMQEKLKAWLDDRPKVVIPDNLKLDMFCYGLQNASFSLWEEVLNKSKTSAYMKEKKDMVAGLGCSNQKYILENYLYDALENKTGVGIVTALFSVYNSIPLGNDVALETFLDFIVPNITKIYWNIDAKVTLISLIEAFSEDINTKEQLAKLKVIENSNIPIPEDLIAVAESNVEENIKWLQEHDEILKQELKM